MTTTTTAANPQVTSFWADEGGQAWAELQDVLDRLHQPIGEVVVEQAFPGRGGGVLDVGCGAGATTLDMARRLAPEGRSIGVDVSRSLLELATARAREEAGLPAAFVEADAQDHDFGEEAFDAVMSRFGVMFFSDFDAAFANLRRSARPDGRLVFACWRSPDDNPMAEIPLQAAAPFLPPIPAPDLTGPGRFAFADPDRIRGILARSGWRDAEISPLDTPTPVGLDDLITVSLRLGFLGPLLRQQDEAVRRRVAEAVADSLGARAVDGVVPLTAACWLVTARA